MVAQAATHRLIPRKPLREATMRSGRLSRAIAGCNDEVGRTDESTKQVHMTWVEDATKYEDKQCLQRYVTEVDVSRRGAGRTCLMFIVTEYVAMVKTGNECLLGNYMSSRGKNCYGILLRGSVVPTKFLLVLLNTLPVEDETSNALVVVWVGNGARCVSRDVTLHRLSAYSCDSLTLHLSTAVWIIQEKECLCVIHVLNLSSLVVSASVARTIRRSFRVLTSHMVAELLVIQCSSTAEHYVDN